MRDRQKESYRGKSPAMQRVEKMRKKRVQRERIKHKYNNILDKLKNLNLIIEQNNNIALTQRGRELSNTVFIEFID